ncbi:hypothetical protein SAMN04487820_104347 [Actinopolyspora mzabensis]|uniref:Polyketide synthase-like phosphopantetheine-binding domain-containing protein n=1 Tax=Actinopolyspora mzabensis TaxID=995066 RepID=A0A1G8ZB93_ACTMZ|nr:phosphopantetheine-binding protein [Actinopolyspora mzabensis]SDK12297.1 hypothetical protein SAMN04487820_104347 [Actinopolyspora mzabensis]
MNTRSTARDRAPCTDPETLRATDIDERVESIERFLCQEVTRALELPSEHSVDPSKPLHTQGVGSIVALRLERRIRLLLRIDIGAVRILRASSVTELAALCAMRIVDPYPLRSDPEGVSDSVPWTDGGRL